MDNGFLVNRQAMFKDVKYIVSIRADTEKKEDHIVPESNLTP